MKDLIRNFLIQQRSLILFLIVGTLTAVVYFSLFTLTWKWMNLNYKVAVSISYICAVVFQFSTNRRVTFESHHENVVHQAFKFLGLIVINYILTMIIVTWAVNTLAVSPYLGVIISLSVTVITGFLLSRLWVFRKSERQSSSLP